MAQVLEKIKLFLLFAILIGLTASYPLENQKNLASLFDSINEKVFYIYFLISYLELFLTFFY